LRVPTARRDAILKLAYDSVYGGHLGERKTRQCIKLSFYWAGLKRSVRDYVMSCQDCQRRACKLTTDRGCKVRFPTSSQLGPRKWMSWRQWCRFKILAKFLLHRYFTSPCG